MGSIQFDHIYKRFPDGTEAVKDLTLEIDDGEFVILVGPSGCGKSTALRMVAGLEDISEGQMTIGGRVVNDLTPKDRDIAMVFQSYALYPHMTVAENMGFALKLSKVPKEEIRERVEDAAKILGLTEYLDRKPKALSGGQRQRVAMGRAIVRSPQAFLMDEPLSNLDAKLRVQMRAEIAELQDRLGVTTLYVTHDQVEAMTMGDRVAVLKRGVLMQADSPQHLYDHPDNLFVAGFIGSPSMNLAEGEIVRDDDGTAVRLSENVLMRIPAEATERYPRVVDYAGRRVVIGMRPEHFFRPDAATSEDQLMPQRNVTLVEALGSELVVHFGMSAPPPISDDMREAIDDPEAFEQLVKEAQSGGQQFTAKLNPENAPRLGDKIDVAFDTRHLHFFDLENGLALR